MTDISYHNKDITAKTIAEALKGKSLEVFGLPHLNIVEILPTNLPAIESNELRLDNLFVLSDHSLALIDYESAFSQANFVKYLNYAARIVKRYLLNHELKQLTSLKIIIIYTADVEQAESVYDLGGVSVTVESAFLLHLNTNQIYTELLKKINSRTPLSDTELMKLMLLPLSVKGVAGKQKAIISVVNLAKQLPDRTQMIQALAGILTFSDKVIDPDYKQKIKEEMCMTQIGKMLIEEGIEQGIEQGEKRISQLILKLLEDNRSEDIKRIAADRDYQRQLLKEYHL